MYEDTQAELSALLPTIKQAIQKVKDKLDRLSAFNSETSGLFGSSVARFNAVSTCASAIGAANFDTTGRLVFSFNNPNDFQGFKDLAHQGGLPEKVVASVLTNGIMKKAIREVERPEVMEDDEIEVQTGRFTSGGITQTFRQVKNITTGKTLDFQGDSSLFSQFMAEYNGSTDVTQGSPIDGIRQKTKDDIKQLIPKKDELKVDGIAGSISSAIGALGQYTEIQGSKKFETEKVSGKAYLQQQKEGSIIQKKVSEEASKKSAKQVQDYLSNDTPSGTGGTPNYHPAAGTSPNSIRFNG
ncbi:hypothetical protein [Lactovum odontotermitis]